MKVHLQYSTGSLAVDLPTDRVTVIEPKFLPGLPDEAAGFRDAVRKPIGSKPLKELIKSSDKVAVVIPDITRPLPSDRLLPWLFEELAHVPAGNITIINGTGSHRINTVPELECMVGAEIVKKYRIVNHDSHKPETLAYAGKDTEGKDVHYNKEYVQADKRIVMGFIEPHFMAGFSGGYKGIFPAVADLNSIMRYHDALTIGHPKSCYGLLEGNPTQAKIRNNGALLPVDFCINLTLNAKKQITKFFCGDVMKAHTEGCAFAKSTAMAKCPHRYPLVITSNGGYPLDQNLYQACKGMMAAFQIVNEGGLIISAARCNDGFPDHGAFKNLLWSHPSPQAVLDTICKPGHAVIDQWNAQILALMLIKVRIGCYGEIPGDQLKKAHLEQVTDIAATVSKELNRIGKDAPIAVLPEGPMTIPYVE